MGFAGEFFLALGCITINAIFVAAEFALIKVRASRLQELHHKGNRRAGLVLRMLEDVDGYLSASQFGITLMSIGLGSIGEPAVAATLREHLPEFGGITERDFFFFRPQNTPQVKVPRQRRPRTRWCFLDLFLIN
jgi:CBS domain containing-hemolysin-like protein